jgi:alkanesulfonate monooxygenase SsuD/methylene tetrahydromethanopterin reductase-like flavin-dependent oxidoreductase (luciferase family)
MKYALSTPNFGNCGDARVLAEIAHQAEDAGWDGYFLWDHVAWPNMEPIVDPWVALGAMAMRTERIRLGTMITPIARRRPTKLAREATTLDHLTGGRVTLGFGGGVWPEEFGALGDETDPKIRAAMLDEGLELLSKLWSGKPVNHKGAHYQVETAGFAPPLQQPRIPIWLAATWPIQKTIRRAAQWDGVLPLGRAWDVALTQQEIGELAAAIREYRTSSAPLEIGCLQQTPGDDKAADAALAASYEAAGGTWWFEYRHSWLTSLDDLLARVRKGPPRAV